MVGRARPGGVTDAVKIANDVLAFLLKLAAVAALALAGDTTPKACPAGARTGSVRTEPLSGGLRHPETDRVHGGGLG